MGELGDAMSYAVSNLNDQDMQTIKGMSKYARETLSSADTIIVPYLYAHIPGEPDMFRDPLHVDRGEFGKLVSDLCNRMRNFKGNMRSFHERVTDFKASYVLELFFSHCNDSVYLWSVKRNMDQGGEVLMYCSIDNGGGCDGVVTLEPKQQLMFGK